MYIVSENVYGQASESSHLGAYSPLLKTLNVVKAHKAPLQRHSDRYLQLESYISAMADPGMKLFPSISYILEIETYLCYWCSLLLSL